MKSEEISDSLNFLNDDILKETDKIRSNSQKNRNKRRIVKWVLIAAGFTLLISAGLWGMTLHKQTNNTIQLKMLTLPENISQAMGFEGYMAYDSSELVNANPWNEEMQLSVLPVYQNRLSYDEQNVVSGADFDKMKEFLKETAQKLGINTASVDITDDVPDEKTKRIITEKFQMAGENVPDGYFEPKRVMIETEDLKIEVDNMMTATVSFKTAVSLPDNYNFIYNASYEELIDVAKYLQNQYGDIIGIENPTVNIHGGDYNIYLQQQYSIEFFDAAGSDTEKIVNYNFNRTAFYNDDDGKLFIVRIFRPDLSQKTGDYPIITADEAKSLLAAGNYITTVPYEISGTECVSKTELIYRTKEQEKYYMPYYCFYAEIPQLERNGLKTYGAYYVPAVKAEYISNMPIWDGNMN